MVAKPLATIAKATGHYQGNIAGQEKDLEIKNIRDSELVDPVIHRSIGIVVTGGTSRGLEKGFCEIPTQ